MTLRFIGKDPESKRGDCPTVFVDEASAELVIQGWKADSETVACCEEAGPVPEHEAVVRVPVRMVEALREACNVARRAQHR